MRYHYFCNNYISICLYIGFNMQLELLILQLPTIWNSLSVLWGMHHNFNSSWKGVLFPHFSCPTILVAEPSHPIHLHDTLKSSFFPITDQDLSWHFWCSHRIWAHGLVYYSKCWKVFHNIVAMHNLPFLFSRKIQYSYFSLL